MSKQVIILNVDESVPGLTQIRLLFWLTAPSTAQIPQPGIGSIYANATAAELTNLANGVIVEEQYTFHFATNKTKAQIEADILAAFQSRQAAFTASPPGAFFGLYCDSGDRLERLMCCDSKEIVANEPPAPVNNAERLRNTPACEPSYIPIHEANVLGWRAWYADRTMYDSRETSWADLPPEGIQIVMVYENKQFLPGRHYRRQFVEADWYVADCSVKLGTVIEDEDFDKIRDEAAAMESW